MKIIYYHNTKQDVPNIEGIAENIFKKYGVKIKIKQDKSENPYMFPFFKITEIEIDKEQDNGQLEAVITEIHQRLR